MSGFASIFQHGRALALMQHARSIAFQPRDPEADEETVTAIVGAVMADLVDADDQRIKMRRRFIEVPTRTEQGGPTERQRGGVYTIDDEPWSVFVEAGVDGSTGLARLELHSPEQVESGGHSERAGG